MSKRNGGLCSTNTRLSKITTTKRDGIAGTFEFYDEMDEFMSGSDKVNPKFVKETRVMQVRPKDSLTSSDSGSSDASATVTIADPTRAVGNCLPDIQPTHLFRLKEVIYSLGVHVSLDRHTKIVLKTQLTRVQGILFLYLSRDLLITGNSSRD